jgi:hypothetical protein
MPMTTRWQWLLQYRDKNDRRFWLTGAHYTEEEIKKDYLKDDSIADIICPINETMIIVEE